jgi:hypothetical protein
MSLAWSRDALVQQENQSCRRTDSDSDEGHLAGATISCRFRCGARDSMIWVWLTDTARRAAAGLVSRAPNICRLRRTAVNLRLEECDRERRSAGATGVRFPTAGTFAGSGRFARLRRVAGRTVWTEGPGFTGIGGSLP